jgi:hypothetical protein
MSGIDSPIKKFQLIPRRVVDDIYKKRIERAQQAQLEARARQEKEEAEKQRAIQLRVDLELKKIMRKLETQFEDKKATLLDGSDVADYFSFSYTMSDWVSDYAPDVKVTLIQRAREEIESNVRITYWGRGKEMISCDVSVVEPPETTQINKL